jgi:membrane fusion protein (multidrug efflux system)
MLGKKKVAIIALAIIAMFGVAGCSSSQEQQKQTEQAVIVDSINVIKKDIPRVFDYTGFIEADKEVNLAAHVSGNLTKQFAQGGEMVSEGQALFEIDPRTYKTAVLNGKANLATAKSEQIRLKNDVRRYKELFEKGAVSKQTYQSIEAQFQQANANVEAKEALLEAAKINLDDTIIRAPFSGKLGTNDLNVGNYVTAGSTIIATISNSTPILVNFSISETEYLKLMSNKKDKGDALADLTLTLSDGSVYPYRGKLAEVNRNIGDNTGTLTVKAKFDNPDNILIPGMFAHITAVAGIQKGAILVPQRAISQELYKNFVSVIDKDNKVKLQEVKLGTTVGQMQVIESGLKGDEEIIVEGLNKVHSGSLVKPRLVTAKDLNLSE